MKGLSTKARVVGLAMLMGGLGGALSFWPFLNDEERKFNQLRETALCVLDLPEGSGSVSASFTTAKPVESFQVGVQDGGRGTTLSLSISGARGLVGSVTFAKTKPFGLGRGVQPGAYTATLRQEADGKGGLVVIAGERPAYVTGWQVWSRTYLGLTVLSGVCVLLTRRVGNLKLRATSLAVFHLFVLGCALMFLYLLLHEGGHALVQMSFGRFDWAQSDFWGIHGHPHSGGGRTGPPLEMWQQTLISCAGPMLPTLTGFALFLLWALPAGRKLRVPRPMLNLYLSAVVGMLVFSEAVAGPLYLLGFIRAEGDLVGQVGKAGGPVWLVKSLLWGFWLACVFILWQVGPEVARAWKARFVQSGKDRSLPATDERKPASAVHAGEPS